MDLPEALILASSEWNRAMLPESQSPSILLSTAWMLSRIRQWDQARSFAEQACTHRFAADPLFVFQKKVVGELGYAKEMGLETIPWPFFSADDWLRYTFRRNKEGRIRFWDPELGWLTTSEEEYPIFRQCREQFRKLEYIPGTNHPREFINLANGEKMVV